MRKIIKKRQQPIDLYNPADYPELPSSEPQQDNDSQSGGTSD